MPDNDFTPALEEFHARRLAKARSLNPIAPALLAMFRWSDEYALQRGGCMDFWDKLADHRKRLCIEAVKRILDAPLSETEEVT